MLGNFGIIIWCGIRVHFHIRAHIQSVAFSSLRKVNRQISIVLWTQVSISICNYFCLKNIINFLKALLPLVTIVPSVISRLSTLLAWHQLDAFWPNYSLVVAAFVPWLSVANPLVTILFVERYRRFLVGLFQRNLARVAGTSSNRMMPQEIVLQAMGPNIQRVNTVPA